MISFPDLKYLMTGTFGSTSTAEPRLASDLTLTDGSSQGVTSMLPGSINHNLVEYTSQTLNYTILLLGMTKSVLYGSPGGQWRAGMPRTNKFCPAL